MKWLDALLLLTNSARSEATGVATGPSRQRSAEFLRKPDERSFGTGPSRAVHIAAKRPRFLKNDRSAKKREDVSIRLALVRRQIETQTEKSMKYLSFVRSSEEFRDAQPPAAMMEAMGKLIEKFSKEGALVDTGGLTPSRDGFRMRLANRKLTFTDGPFADSKEVIGGWAILKAESKAEILRLTTEFMELHRTYWPEFEGECEVRPIEFIASDAPQGR